MGAKGTIQEEEPNSFFEIVKKAYDRGTSDRSVTLEKLMDELIIDLGKLKG